jgi:dienelactone hydrolase
VDSLVGRSLAHYRIKSLLGQGGMGAVYRAEDTHLGRDVAIKVLPQELAQDPDRLRRFQREARAVAALNHPSIVTIHSVEESEGIHFLTLELVEGEPLGKRIPAGGMPLDAFFAVAEPLTLALAAAHARGIVHRDVKPANVMVTATGETKVLDFGLARVDVGAADETAPTQSATRLGAVVGTPAYMSPEQARAVPVDARSDVFSTGVVLYEMLTGRQPFRRVDVPSTIHAILHDDPGTVRALRPEVPGDLSRVVARCLDKDPAGRFASGAELVEALAACRRRIQGQGWRSRRVLVPLALGLALVAALGVFWIVRDRRERKIRAETIPRIEALLEAGSKYEAFVLAREALQRMPDDPMLQRLHERSSFPVTVTTRPAGAEVTFRHYRDPDGAWQALGTTPIERARVPDAYVVFRVERDGYEPMLATFGDLSVDVELIPEGSAPQGMVRVPEGTARVGGARPTTVPVFWIDRYEVTNGEFQRFVDAGGYSNPEYWREACVEEGRTLPRDEAMARFVDLTGRPGPAGWELGRHPEGKERYPVGGVSWYEAAAYALWAGKSLPTVHHWRRAAGVDIFSDILTLSNFEGDGPAPVGQHQGLGPFGTYDMAGNVKEWCANPTGTQRFALGGAWDESSYLFADDDARDPFDRSEDLGFRCVRFDSPPPRGLGDSIGDTRYDFADIEPVNDEVYRFLAGLYDAAASPSAACANQAVDDARLCELDPRVEREDDTPRDWRYEAISVEPTYSGPRLVIHLFLPRDAKSPYQIVVERPNSSVNQLTRIEDYASLPDFIPRSGRALAIPAYWGTLGRQADSSDMRERVVRQVQDFRRTIDYLETREDIDTGKLAYTGTSAGGEYAPIYLAVEPRVRAAVLVAAGFHDAHMLDEPSEINPWNFSPRVTMPTLVINGKDDFMLPRETAQRPFFDLLGTEPAHKRFVTIEGGHVTADRHTRIRETLDWLDRYLGPVERASGQKPRGPSGMPR